MHDVIIIGGAFSGSSMGILIKRERPEAKVLIIERREAFDRKVGESTSEVAACFLTQVLRLTQYMGANHLNKQGLRMWFTTPENKCLTKCSEIGAYYQTRLPTFQIDRSHLDQHLLELAEKEGCEVWRPAKVEKIDLPGGNENTVVVKVNDETRIAKARWVVDASGKAATLSRKLGHWRKLDTHPTNSIWARFQNVGDLDGAELATRFPDFAASVRCSRRMATNHLMGRGWWCWIIPLKNGDVSLGLTFDPRVFNPPKDGSIAERLLAHAKQHPVGEFLFKNAVPAEEQDPRAYSHLPYYSEQVTGDGWAIVGDAAGFMDPLYSQGLDYCSYGVYSVHRFILDSLMGKDVRERQAAFNVQFKESYFRWYHSLYHNKYYYLGEGDLCHAAFLMDLACYYLGPVRFAYERPEEEFSAMPYNGTGGAVFAKFMSFYNQRLSHIAKKRIAAGLEGAENLGHRWLIKQGFIPSFKVLALLRSGIKVWLRAEWKALFLPSVAPHPVKMPKRASTVTA